MRALACLLLAVGTLVAQNNAPNLATIHQIKEEAFDRSQVMDTLWSLTDVHGPRLTGSPEFQDAADWAVKRLQQYGISNVHTERWGPFGRSWSLQHYALEMVEPRYALLSAAPLAWTRSTNGPVTGDLILTPLTRSRDPNKARTDFEAYKKQWTGKLRGKIVMLTTPKVPASETRPQFRRYTDAELAELASAPTPTSKARGKLNELKFPEDPDELRSFYASLPEDVIDEIFDLSRALQTERNQFFIKEGAIAVVQEDPRAHESLVFAEQAGGHTSKDPLALPTFTITAEQYNRIARLMEKKVPVRLRFDLQAKASNNDVDGLNIVGEIPGGAKRDEIVMVGAHFDSWHTGTGATDNAAGSAVMMEVMRILKALDLKMDRTVRIALWSGEEQGLYGSKAYVKSHFGDYKTMQFTPEHAKLSGYFNLDNGSGKIRGVYLQGNEMMRPYFERWLAPFRDQGVTTISIRNTGGTDHLSFDAVGLPGFQFIQDPLDYSTVTHHSNMDTYDHAIPADLMQAASVIASVVYDAATMPEMLPRKPMSKPQMTSAPTDGR